MLSTEPFGLTSNQPQYPISNTADPKWAPKSIMYLKIDYMVSSSGLSIYYHPDSGFYDAGAGVRDFTDSLLANAPMSPKQFPQPGNLALNHDPALISKSLAFFIEYDYYVVIEIANGNWRLKFNGDAISVNVDTKSIYWDLYHLNDDGDYIPGDAMSGTSGSAGAPGDPWRRIMYFSAKALPPTAGAQHRMNIYVRLTQDDTSVLDLIIDPDVQNTGHH